MVTSINLLGVNISRVTPAKARDEICCWIKEKKKNYVCVAPVATLVDAKRNPLYAEAVNGAGMITPDGMPVVWLARLRGCQDIERTYGPDLMRALCNHGQSLGLRHFFYGGTENTLDCLKNKLMADYPKMIIAGMYAPPFNIDVVDEEKKILDLINQSSADILWVGLGSPKQDFWSNRHRPLLNTSVIIGAGAAFDFCAGIKPQAPRWMQACGLEWFFRLCSEPRRLWKRYLIGNSLFIIYVIKDLFKKSG